MIATAIVLLGLGYRQAGNASTLSIRMDPVPQITLTGEPGNYTLEYANALGNNQTNWFTLAGVTLTGNPTNWLDYDGMGQRQRFYRLVAATNIIPANPRPELLAWIPAGTFVMGSPTNEALREANGPEVDEKQHTVTLTKGFYMSKYPVRQGDYLSVVGSNPSFFAPGNGYSLNTNLPVEMVNWYDATNYCSKLNQQEQSAGRLPSGWAYRLPTESEWEYACRAGTTTAFYFGNAIRAGMENFDTHYEYDASIGDITTNTAGVGYVGKTSPVGSYGANPWGLYDMCGNVCEWCQDCFGPYPTGSVSDPVAASDTGHGRVVRNGHFNASGHTCRSALRRSHGPDEYHNAFGFRPVLAPVQP